VLHIAIAFACRRLTLRIMPLSLHSLLLSTILIITISITPAHSQLQRSYHHDGGLWGGVKRATGKIISPVERAVHKRYEKLSDRGKFVAGAVLGFGASRFAVSSEFYCDYFVHTFRALMPSFRGTAAITSSALSRILNQVTIILTGISFP